jgi:hypothetical protein
MTTITVVRKPELPISIYNHTVKLSPYYGIYTREKKEGLNFALWKLTTKCSSGSLQDATEDLKTMFVKPIEYFVVGYEDFYAMEPTIRC